MSKTRSRTTAATLLLLLLTIGLYGYSVWRNSQHGLNMVSPSSEALKDSMSGHKAKKGGEDEGSKLAMTQNRIDEMRDAVAASAAVGGGEGGEHHDNNGPDPRGGGNPGGPNPGGQIPHNPNNPNNPDTPIDTPPLSPSGPQVD